MPDAAPPGEDLSRFQRRGISLAIVVIVGLQAVAGFKLLCPPQVFPSLSHLRIGCPPALWPFTDYPMYESSYEPGQTVSNYQLFAVLDDGQRVPLVAERFDMTPRRFRHEVIDRLLWGHRGPVQAFARRVGGLLGPPARLVLENHPLRQDVEGLVELPVEPVLDYAFDRAGRLQ